MAKFCALVVHAHAEALGELVEILSGPDLWIDTARNAEEALHKLAVTEYAVIVTDHKPPDLDGIALLERSLAISPDSIRVILASDSEAARSAPAKIGLYLRFFAKPWERNQLAGTVYEGLKLYRLQREQREKLTKLALEHQRLKRREKLLDTVVKERTKELEESCVKLRTANRQALLGLAEAIEAKDSYTKGHCGRVAACALALARAAKYPEEAMEPLEFGAFLHDIGKIGVRDAVLLKPGPLDNDEWAHMRLHTIKGYEIASQIDMLKPSMPAIRNHHERWDGGGYPDGLKGLDIPLSARIVAIADAFDAMATDRPYKPALALAECERVLKDNAGSMFDPDLVTLFVNRHLGAPLYGDASKSSDSENTDVRNGVDGSGQVDESGAFDDDQADAG